MRMRWLSLLFMHWRAPVEAVRAMQPRIPDELEIDTFDGSAWVGLVPFTMRDVNLVWMPRIPKLTDFHECNVRTYVRPRDGREAPGVWFFSLDAASRIAVWGARSLWKLPYHFARLQLRRDGDMVRYAVDREGPPAGRLRCAWLAGQPRGASRPGDLGHFLTERYVLYTLDRLNRLNRCRIAHPQWPLREASVLELDDSLMEAAGFALPDDPPIAWHADELDVRAERLQPVR